MSHMEGAAARSAWEFLRNMDQVCERLAKRNIVLRSVHADWGLFGCWVIEASNGEDEEARGAAIRAGEYDAAGPEFLRVVWDGRDGVLTAERGRDPTVTTGGGRPDPIVPRAEFSSSKEALAAAEELLVEHLADWA